MPKRREWRRLTKPRVFILVLVVLLVAFRLSLPVLAKNYINRQLNRDPLYHGQVEKVGISLWRGAYTLKGLDLRRVKGQKDFPLLAADEVDIGVSWKELVHRAIRMKLDVKKLVVNIVQEKEEGKKKITVGPESAEAKKREAQDWKKIFKNLVPIDVGRLAIDGTSIHFRDLAAHPPVNLFLDRLEVRGENLTNSSKLSNTLFGTVDVRARAMESGDLHLVLYINPLASPPDFKATVHLNGLELTRLNDFFKAYGSFDVKSGTLDVYSEMATARNKLKGYVKPIIKNLKVADLKKDVKKGGVLHAAWEVIVGAIGGIFKNHKENQQAAKVNFEGRLDDPKMSGWQVVESILYNMLVKPIKPGTNQSIELADVGKQKK